MNAIIFDIDGTLTDTTEVDDKCFKNAFRNVFGIDISNQRWSEIANVTDWGITEEIIQKNWKRFPTHNEYQEMISNFLIELKSAFHDDEKQFQEVKGAVRFINYLRQKTNITIGIATGGWEKSANLKLNSIGIDSSKFIFSNSNHFKSREDILSDAIRKINKKWNNKIDRTIYFGDGTWDYLTCKKLDIEFIGIDNANNRKLKEIGAKIIFNDFRKFELIYKEIET